MYRFRLLVVLVVPVIPHIARTARAQSKPQLTLDAFFNSISFPRIAVSPNGQQVVIQTERSDWQANRFREDLWLYRTSSSELTPLTTSGHDSDPQWSPDGNWIAFRSDRLQQNAKDAEIAAEQVYAISVSGGEAFRVTTAREDVLAFAWSADSRAIFFATRQPWTKKQEDKHKDEWKDTVQYRESERGSDIFKVNFTGLEKPASAAGQNPDGQTISSTPYRVQQLATSPDGKWLAFSTESRSQREESLSDDGIYTIDLSMGSMAEEKPVPLLLHPQAFFDTIQWASDSKYLFFSFLNGSVEGPYQDAQARIYWVRANGPGPSPCGSERDSGCERWGSKFFGSMEGFAALSNGGLLAAGRGGTEVQPYVQREPSSAFEKQSANSGTYAEFATAERASTVAFVYSSLQSPAEVYLARSPSDIKEARRITSFNQTPANDELPRGRPFLWKADDGVGVEGMLIYPPGKFGEKNLPMFTFIHGGPEDADGNHFEADWYQWADLAATDGWLVFEPNYRGSVGYGDAFALGIIPHIVSRPGKDILEGVDALVKDGIADPNHLTVGGYSYGGYMTNWLITQTTRFKAAVTGAGAVEHVVNWGNDDTTFDDAYFLGGLPWKTEQNYNDEAAIWQIGKVRTPTHIVAGADDIRVYVGEDYLLERALHTMGVPCTLLIFPGEGHGLANNPWHGKIKVREELKWLDKYGRN